MQRFTSRAPAMHGTKRHDPRETIERSEINASVFLGQDTRKQSTKAYALPGGQAEFIEDGERKPRLDLGLRTRSDRGQV